MYYYTTHLRAEIDRVASDNVGVPQNTCIIVYIYLVWCQVCVCPWIGFGSHQDVFSPAKLKHVLCRNESTRMYVRTLL